MLLLLQNCVRRFSNSRSYRQSANTCIHLFIRRYVSLICCRRVLILYTDPLWHSRSRRIAPIPTNCLFVFTVSFHFIFIKFVERFHCCVCSCGCKVKYSLLGSYSISCFSFSLPLPSTKLCAVPPNSYSAFSFHSSCDLFKFTARVRFAVTIFTFVAAYIAAVLILAIVVHGNCFCSLCGVCAFYGNVSCSILWNNT